MASRINKAIVFAVITGAVISYKLVTRSDDVADSLNSTVKNIAESEAILAEQKAKMVAFEAKDDWILGRWDLQFNSNGEAPDWMVFEKDRVKLFFLDGTEKKSGYFIYEKELHFRSRGYANLTINDDGSELSSDNVVYRRF